MVAENVSGEKKLSMAKSVIEVLLSELKASFDKASKALADVQKGARNIDQLN